MSRLSPSPLILRSNVERKKVPIERFARRLVFIVADEKITDDFPQSAEFFETQPMLGVGNGQIQKFETA